MAKKSKVPMIPKTQKANANAHRMSKFLFFLNFVLEAAAAGLCSLCVFFPMYELAMIPEICAYVFLHLIFAAIIPDFAYTFLMCKLSALGIDPLGICFNFLIGLMCISIGLPLLTVLIYKTGNKAMQLQVSAGVFATISGLLHLFNGIRCHRRIPRSEKYYRPKDPNRQKLRQERKRMAKEAKKNEKNKKADTKADKTPKKGKGKESV